MSKVVLQHTLLGGQAWSRRLRRNQRLRLRDDDALARWVNGGADYALSLPPK